MKFILMLILIISSDFIFAASGGAGHSEIPWPTIKAQVINVILTIGLLIYLLKDKVPALFSGRVEKFDEEFKKAKALKEAATEKRNDVKSRLENLKVTADKSISEAKENSIAKTSQLLIATEGTTKRIISDVEDKMQNQKNKIIGELKKEILEQSFAKAKANMSDNLSQPELNRLNKEFISNIQVVQ